MSYNNIEKQKEHNRKYREKNKERLKEYAKKYKEEHKEELKERGKKYREENKELMKEQYRRKELKLNYGITQEEYNNLFIKQDGKCLICGKHQSELKNKLCVDHDHVTKKIRGLLCHNCNLGIGHLQDNIEILQTALEYLIRYSK